jgi:hypothetical protein
MRQWPIEEPWRGRGRHISRRHSTHCLWWWGRHSTRREVGREHGWHRHIAIRTPRPAMTSGKPRRWKHRASLLGRRHLPSPGHPIWWHLIHSMRRRSLEDLGRLVLSRLPFEVVERVVHGESGWRLGAHCPLIVPILSSREFLFSVSVRCHRRMLLKLGLGLGRNPSLIRSWCIWRHSHQIHQELGIVIVAGGIGLCPSIGSLTRNTLMESNKVH